MNGLIIDCFAGGGGASHGIELALGRSPDIAINHDPEAIAMHEANHPRTEHHCESVYKVRPREVCRGRPVDLAWFSPDCTYHSRARGGKPFRDPKSAKGRRGLAWQVTRWAREVSPPIIRVNGEVFEIADITSRMLEPRELFRGQGFPDSYVIDPIVDGAPLSKTAQVRMVGNSAPPHVVAALIRANTGWQEREVAA